MVEIEKKLLLGGSKKELKRKGSVAKKNSPWRSLSLEPLMGICGKGPAHNLALELGARQSLETHLERGCKEGVGCRSHSTPVLV